jgi:hypothetical protein
MYNSTGSKSARYARTKSSTNVGVLLYLLVQAYTCSGRTCFKTVYGLTWLVGVTYNFAYISSDAVLYTLSPNGWKESAANSADTIDIATPTLDLFNVLLRAT